MFRVLVIIALVGVVGCTGSQDSSQHTPTSTSQVVNSLFADDSCAPPCWFGLTPGESTIDDVVAMFRTYAEIFIVNPYQVDENVIAQDFDALVAGERAEFLWQDWQRDDGLITPSYIGIRDSILEWINVSMNVTVPLNQTLQALGFPNYVRTTIGVEVTYLKLFYANLSLIIVLSAARDECNVPNFLDEYTVDYLLYYDVESFDTLSEDLLLEDDPIIPDEIWNAWLTGETEGSCTDAIGQIINLSVSQLTPTPSLIETPKRCSC